MRKFNNVEEITEGFINDGWSNVTFSMVSKDESKSIGLWIVSKIEQGQKFFKMNETGNIFDEFGRIKVYDVSVK